MHPKELLDGHFEKPKVDVFDPFFEIPDHQGLIEFLYFGETGAIDRLKPREPALHVRSLLPNMCQRVVTPAVVVAVVADGRCPLRRFAHLVFPLIGNQPVKFLAARLEVRRWHSSGSAEYSHRPGGEKKEQAENIPLHFVSPGERSWIVPADGRITHKVGGGGKGVVYIAEDTGLGAIRLAGISARKSS